MREPAARLLFNPEAIAGDVPLDAILAWDLFSYLEPETTTALVSRLGRACRRGTMLFLLASTQEGIPQRPVHYRILDKNRLVLDADFTALHPNPRITPRAFERMMPRFHLRHAFLSRTGVQEYLFGYE